MDNRGPGSARRLDEPGDVGDGLAGGRGQVRERRGVADHTSLALLRDEGGVGGVDELGEVEGHGAHGIVPPGELEA